MVSVLSMDIKLFLITVVPVILIVAFFTVAERKLMAAVQRRSGPGFYSRLWGLCQGIFDGIKLILKEMLIIKPYKSVFVGTPILLFALSLLGWFLLPFSRSGAVVDVSHSLLMLLVILSVSVFGPIFAGWASCNNYAWYGALRAVSQVLQYEVILTLCILPPALLGVSLHLEKIVLAQKNLYYYGLPFFMLSIVFFICSLVETNRAPFDLPETESELVAGFHTEYSGVLFALFFLAEYSFMALGANINAILFWGGWNGCKYGEFSLAFKSSIFYALFILVRASFPRFRFDQLVNLSWKRLLPVLFGFLFLVLGLRVA